jgi:FkbM family methyltransferase
MPLNLTLKLAVLAAMPAPVRRLLMTRRFRDEVERTGEAEMLYLPDWVGPGDLAIDVGANLGGYTYELSRLSGHVIAFEPNPAMASAIGSLHLPGVVVRPEALSDISGEITLHIPHGQKHVLASIELGVVAGEECATVTVPTAPLDSLELNGVRFIKIDVEGAEERVLKGASATIARERPILLVEIEERHNVGGLRRIDDSLSAIGYKGWFLTNAEWQPLSRFDAETMQNPAVLLREHSCRREIRYVNNFLFLPEGSAAPRVH